MLAQDACVPVRFSAQQTNEKDTNPSFYEGCFFITQQNAPRRLTYLVQRGQAPAERTQGESLLVLVNSAERSAPKDGLHISFSGSKPLPNAHKAKACLCLLNSAGRPQGGRRPSPTQQETQPPAEQPKLADVNFYHINDAASRLLKEE